MIRVTWDITYGSVKLLKERKQQDQLFVKK